MSYYSELGLYSGGSNYSSLYLPGPYSNHSSIIAANFTRPSSSLTKPFSRNYRGYVPHLATITERTQSPLRRINSPKFTPSVQIPRPIKINTADIDVSVNKYRKYDRPNRQKSESPQSPVKAPEKETLGKEKSKSPSPSKPPPAAEKTESPAGSLKELEAKPTKVIRRDRATVRLHTIHKDKLHQEVANTYRKWRDNFDPKELNTEENSTKTVRKTPGELLKEKFLIRCDDVKEVPEEPVKSKNKGGKQTNFHDICKQISSENVNELLNPGQPEAVRRKQSRTLSNENLLKQIRRNSSELSKGEVAMLDTMLQAEHLTTEPNNQNKDEIKHGTDEGYDSQNNQRRRKKITKKKSSELLLPASDNSDSDKPKSPILRRPTQKHIRRTSTNSSLGDDTIEVDPLINEMYQHAIRDISQVEIEEIKTKPKPVVTATVEVDEKVKPSLKAIIDEVEVEEAPKQTKPPRRKFNVIVEEVEEKKPKRRNVVKFQKIMLDENHFGLVHLPKGKEPVVSDIAIKRPEMYQGKILNVKDVPKKKIVAEALKLVESELPVNIQYVELQSPKSPETKNIDDTIKQKVLPEALKLVKSELPMDKQDEELQSPKSPKTKKIHDSIKRDASVNESETPPQSPRLKKVFSNKSAALSKTKSTENVQTKNKEDIRKTSSQEKTPESPIEKIAPKVTPPLKKVAPVSPLAKNNNEKSPIEKLASKATSPIKKIPPTSALVLEINKSESNSTITSTTSDSSEQDKSESKQFDKSELKENEDDRNDVNLQLQKVPSKSSLKNVNVKSSVVKKVHMEEVEEDESSNASGKSVDSQQADESVVRPAGKITSKRSLVCKANKVDDPEMKVFNPPTPEPVEETKENQEEEDKDGFVPLKSNRLSQWMNPWKKPEQHDECPIEIYATPKVIRHRHYPRPRKGLSLPVEESSSSEENSSSEETSSGDEDEENVPHGSGKVGASTSSNDSGFDSTVTGSRNKGSATENRESPTTSASQNPDLALDEPDGDDYTKSSTFIGFQKSGRITPPATTIPRFRKYNLEDFTFLKVLGKGSFGKVLLAELKNTEYYYAIKCLKKDVVLEDDDVECTLIERKVLALGTKHPYLCHLLCTFQTDSHLFFVMEYLNGGDLMFHIQQSGRFSEDRARFYGAEIVSGLKFLHNKGIVYRDLKLDNILLDYDGHVRIADFGMCKLQIFLDRMADTFCGTPDYMAPEIIKGLHYNQNVDWWSFGVLLYEMLIGQSPFSGCDEDELFWSICNEKPVLPRFLSDDAREILSRFLEKDGGKRLGNRFCTYGDIQDQQFFKQIDWQMLEARQLEAPFKPRLLHPLDTQYFDKHFTSERAKLTPIDERILQSMDQTQFQGFSYTNPNATDK